MSSSRQLTGGTNDVSPQWLSISAAQSAADTTTTITTAIPVQRLGNGTRAQVMEVLKVWFQYPTFPPSASATEAFDNMSAMLSTTSFGTTTVAFSDPRVFAGVSRISRHAFTAAGTYFQMMDNTVLYDCTDGAGHGVLVATDNIFTQIASVTTGTTNTFSIKILYRWKNVSLAEYVGIVQSQQ